ncbi:MAG: hypothetical protein EXS64_08230 [Candidatus Latescibacteria bacterium]|nr:hypothetical protein [Candidatus Latescibacterota bacterium]
MLGNSPSQVKSNPHPATFAIGDPEDRLSIAHAMREGYTLTLDGDGCAEILKADGTAYHVHEWQCDCPDAQGRDGGSYGVNGHRTCKHVLWIAQLYPCQYCGSTMHLAEHTTCFGETFKTFDCPTCKNAVDFGFIRGQRRFRRVQARQQAEQAGREAANV